MKKETMTVTQALAELKMLDARIQKKINDGVYINYVTSTSVMGADDVEKMIKASYQSISDLIERRNAIKNAVVVSNSKSKVTVGGKKYTVAEAIDMKSHGMLYKNSMLQQMMSQLSGCTSQFEAAKNRVEEKALNLGKTTEDTRDVDVARATEVYAKWIKEHPVTLVDPLKLKDRVAALEAEISEFVLNVDVALSVSNATTTITIGDED